MQGTKLRLSRWSTISSSFLEYLILTRFETVGVFFLQNTRVAYRSRGCLPHLVSCYHTKFDNLPLKGLDENFVTLIKLFFTVYVASCYMIGIQSAICRAHLTVSHFGLKPSILTSEITTRYWMLYIPYYIIDIKTSNLALTKHSILFFYCFLAKDMGFFFLLYVFGFWFFPICQFLWHKPCLLEL